mmetsp:Transcript_3095/g.5788  ORF Transcript_3095/g.5788 Transcript_3095/m.5788 type:complete len:203 (-) Transcript_3095:90-698(-)
MLRRVRSRRSPRTAIPSPPSGAAAFGGSSSRTSVSRVSSGRLWGTHRARWSTLRTRRSVRAPQAIQRWCSSHTSPTRSLSPSSASCSSPGSTRRSRTRSETTGARSTGTVSTTIPRSRRLRLRRLSRTLRLRWEAPPSTQSSRRPRCTIPPRSTTSSTSRRAGGWGPSSRRRRAARRPSAATAKTCTDTQPTMATWLTPSVG